MGEHPKYSPINFNQKVKHIENKCKVNCDCTHNHNHKEDYMKEKKRLLVRLKDQCGNRYYFPENDAAKTVLSITADLRRKSLTQKDYDKLISLGFEIEVLKPKVTYE